MRRKMNKKQKERIISVLRAEYSRDKIGTMILLDEISELLGEEFNKGRENVLKNKK
jgi:hypothetical protein